MAETFAFIKRKPRSADEAGLFPAYQWDRDAFNKLAYDRILTGEFKQKRNVDHHRKFFALLQATLDQTDDYKDVEDLLTALCYDLGHYRKIRLLNGAYTVERKSISFAKMDQVEFNRFYERAIGRLADFLGCSVYELEESSHEYYKYDYFNNLY